MPHVERAVCAAWTIVRLMRAAERLLRSKAMLIQIKAWHFMESTATECWRRAVLLQLGYILDLVPLIELAIIGDAIATPVCRDSLAFN